MSEAFFFDASSKTRKKELSVKKVRKIFVNEPLSFRFMMKNPLLADIFIYKIKLVCSVKEDDGKSRMATSSEISQIVDKHLTLRPLETKEVIITATPTITGALSIERIEWELFDVVSCHFHLLKSSVEA